MAKTHKIKHKPLAKVDYRDALFIAFYYRLILGGSHPWHTDVDGSQRKKFKDLTRGFLGISKKALIEYQVINTLHRYDTLTSLNKEFAKFFKEKFASFRGREKRKAFVKHLLEIRERVLEIQAECITEDEQMQDVVNHETLSESSELQRAQEQEPVSEAPGDGDILSCSSPDEYRQMTGKRFRMLKAQKERGLSRDEAFQEFLQNIRNG